MINVSNWRENEVSSSHSTNGHFIWLNKPHKTQLYHLLKLRSTQLTFFMISALSNPSNIYPCFGTFQLLDEFSISWITIGHVLSALVAQNVNLNAVINSLLFFSFSHRWNWFKRVKSFMSAAATVIFCSNCCFYL